MATCLQDHLQPELESASPTLRRFNWGYPLGGALLLFCCAAAATCLWLETQDASSANSGSQQTRELAASPSQHIYIVRHGDKYSSYPSCQKPISAGSDIARALSHNLKDTICYNQSLMGVNPPLTPCGIRQAVYTAEWLQKQGTGNIKAVVVSPFTRTLQTSLPLAKALDLKLHVEYLLSEARQPEGPFREFNVEEPGETTQQLQECKGLWNLDYGSPPIRTPEGDDLYVQRVAEAAEVLKERFPISFGNLVMYTHATTSFSIAYGLCYGKDRNDTRLEEFVNNQAAIAPGGVIHVVRSADGTCTIDNTQNVALAVGCGETPASKCEFSDFPAWYWEHSAGRGPGKCH